MTDRELLELAARAAGCSSLGAWDEKLNCLWDGEGWSFDPLNDDGDALRLAVRLGIHIGFYGDHVAAQRTAGKLHTEQGRDGVLAATRRAIVHAAAASELQPSAQSGGAV